MFKGRASLVREGEPPVKMNGGVKQSKNRQSDKSTPKRKGKRKETPRNTKKPIRAQPTTK